MHKLRKEINYFGMITESLSTLKIHKLTQAQYNRELEAGNLDATALYLTPDELAIESQEYKGCYYRIVDGEIEWINPPMKHLTTYKTTKRFNGAPVYTICYSLWDSPVGVSESCTISIPLNAKIIGVSGAFCQYTISLYCVGNENLAINRTYGEECTLITIKNNDIATMHGNFTIEYII